MSTYLDPLNTGAEAIDGIGLNGINIAHEAYDDIPFNQNSINFDASVSTYTGDIVIVELYYNLGDGFVAQDMNPVGIGSNYQTSINGLNDGMIVEYYIQAVNSEGFVQTYPSNAPENTVVFVVGDLADFYLNDFENNADDWVIGYPSDLATAGIWELAEPIATFNDEGNQIQPGEDNTNEGSYCFITGNGFDASNGGFDDVDGGKTTLISPVFDLESFDEIVLSYWYWYTNNIGDNGNNDLWQVRVSNNGGANWEDLDITSSSVTEWSKKRVLLSDYITFTDNMQFQFVAEDLFYTGDDGSGGSLVEAAVDDFLLEFIDNGTGILGDVNNDESIDVLDIVIVVNMIIGSESPNFSTADFNSDGLINVQDVILLINLVLGN